MCCLWICFCLMDNPPETHMSHASKHRHKSCMLLRIDVRLRDYAVLGEGGGGGGGGFYVHLCNNQRIFMHIYFWM